VLMHSTGEKTVPGPMQEAIMIDPRVKGAIMFGRDRDRPGVIIEPSAEVKVDLNDEKNVVQLRNELWYVYQRR
jgi:hypothetical protein